MVLPPSSLDGVSLGALATSVLAVVVVTGALLARRWRTPHTRDASPPPRQIHVLPGSWPIVGDLVTVAVNEERFHDWLSETCLRYGGEPWRVRIVGQQDMVVVCTPEAFDSVLVSQFSEFPNGDFSNLVLSGLFGRSIMTLDGEDWYRQRKTAAKFFTTKALRVCMLETMQKNVHQLYEVLDRSVTTGASVNLTNLFGQFTLQTFAEIGLGVDFRWIGRTESNPLERGAAAASPATMRRFRVPAFWWQFEKYMGFGPEREMAGAMHDVREWLSGIIDHSLAAFATRQRARQSAQKSPEHGAQTSDGAVKSILELFFEHSQEDEGGLRAEDLVDFILTFVLTAQDTSALTLVRLFLVLTTSPHVEGRIRDEMARVLPELGVSSGTYLTTDHVQHLVYLEATIREVLRLYPTVPLMQKEAGQDTVIGGGIPIRKGEQLCLPSYAMARNPNVWGPDAAEFKPERWIDAKLGTLRTESATKSPAFSTGPRACIGMKLALLELRVVTANLLHRYRFSLAEPNDGDYVVGITLALKSPLRVKITRASETDAVGA